MVCLTYPFMNSLELNVPFSEQYLVQSLQQISGKTLATGKE